MAREQDYGIDDTSQRYLFLPMIPKVATQLACPLSASTFIPLFRSFLVALHAMHCLGITHEDLKPGNILMSATDEPIIADFGFSSFSPQGRKMSGGGGTTEYLSPEKVAVSSMVTGSRSFG